jgi:pimeloyl-ACP methyl ester carboxylesterase
VLLLHGLGRSRAAMDRMARFLHEHGDYECFNVTYPSTRLEIGEHAQNLQHILDHLDGIEEIDFVGHSLGCVVVRHYLADATDAAKGRKPDPPNHQADLAVLAAQSGVFQVVAGKPGQQLGPQWDRLEQRLATPAFPFGIIAGGRGDGRGYNPLLSGDNDGIVSVAGTRLAGATDFLVLPVLHTFMADDPKVEQLTLHFLQQGCFTSPAARKPIEKDPKR